MKKIINLTKYELVLLDVYKNKEIILEPAEIPFEIFPSTRVIPIQANSIQFLLAVFASGTSFIPTLPEETEETIYILDELSAAELSRTNYKRTDVFYFRTVTPHMKTIHVDMVFPLSHLTA